MKTRIIPTPALVALLALSALPATAGETFRTNRGKEYRDCEVVGKDPHGVTFRHSGGMAKLAYSDLPADAQKRFKYDKVEAKRFVDARRPKPAPVVKRAPLVTDRVRIEGLNSYPRGRNIRNPYSLTGSLHNPAAYGASFGGFVQPYYSGSFGAPSLVTSVPGGFYTPSTLRLGARPILDSPVATSIGSYSQYRDVRAGAVRAAVRATSRPVVLPTPRPVARPASRSAGRGRR